MTVAKRAEVELRAGKHGLSAWVDGKWLGSADVMGGTITITVPAMNLLPSVKVNSGETSGTTDEAGQ